MVGLFRFGILWCVCLDEFNVINFDHHIRMVPFVCEHENTVCMIVCPMFVESPWMIIQIVFSKQNVHVMDKGHLRSHETG